MRVILFSIILFSFACKMNKLPAHFTGQRDWNQLSNVSKCEKLLQSDDYEQWETDAINKLRQYNWQGIRVIVFAGNWCSDTQKWLPRLASLQKEVGIPKSIFDFYLLDLNKESKERMEKNWNISHVPTFIVLKNGVEIGRIVETPEKSLEAHFSSILP